MTATGGGSWICYWREGRSLIARDAGEQSRDLIAYMYSRWKLSFYTNGTAAFSESSTPVAQALR